MEVNVIGLEVSGNYSREGVFEIGKVEATATTNNSVSGVCNGLGEDKNYIHALGKFLNNHKDFVIVSSSDTNTVGLVLDKISVMFKTHKFPCRPLRCGSIYNTLDMLQVKASCQLDLLDYIRNSEYGCVALCEDNPSASLVSAVAYICAKNDVEYLICG